MEPFRVIFGHGAKENQEALFQEKLDIRQPLS